MKRNDAHLSYVATSPAEADLKAMWHDAERTAAVRLLQASLPASASLADLVEAIAFTAVQPHAASIRLGEAVQLHGTPQVAPALRGRPYRVRCRTPGPATAARAAAVVLPAAPAPALPVPAAIAAAPVAAEPRQGTALAAPSPRTARHLATAQMRAALLACLRERGEKMSTVALATALTDQGMAAETLRVNQLLRGLEADGDVISEGGRPKSWRLKVRGRTVPEPVIIRRASQEAPAAATAAQVAPPAAGAPATAGATPASPAAPGAATATPALPTDRPMDHTDVQAVAAILRQRFFANS